MEKESAKKIFAFIILGLIMVFLLSNFVVAQESNFEVWGKTAAGAVSDFFETLKINPTALSTILLWLLLFIIIYSIVKNVFSYEGKKGWIMGGLVSLIITVLAFVYIPENFIEAITLQYSAMGATILTVVPLAILLYFTVVVTTNLFFARVIWIFYVVYYFTLFIYKIASAPAGTKIISASNIPYFGAIIAGVIIICVLGWTRKKVFESELDAGTEQAMRGVKLRKASRNVQNEEAKNLIES